MKKSWLITCLINFCIAILMALGLRLAYVFPTNFNYTFLLHAHSHTVILGWCYLAIYVFIIAQFLPKHSQKKPQYNGLFWLTQFSVLGMAATFPFQGYALFSIIFSTLHILCSYFFVYQILKDIKNESIFETQLLRYALIFMLVSTVGVWFLGPIASMGAKDDPFYNTAIQFFLHFQFNGWFVMAIYALFFNQIRHLGITLSQKLCSRFFFTTIIGIVLTFGLPLSWYFNATVFRIINSLGLLFQCIGLYYFILLVQPHYKTMYSNEKFITKFLFSIAFICLILKVVIQSCTIIPEIALTSHKIRNFTVGFIHLTMIGIVNSFLFACITRSPFFKNGNKLSSAGIYIFITGFIYMEFLLFYEGFRAYMSQSYQSGFFINILVATIGIWLGLLLFTVSCIFQKKIKS